MGAGRTQPHILSTVGLGSALVEMKEDAELLASAI